MRQLDTSNLLNFGLPVNDQWSMKVRVLLALECQNIKNQLQNEITEKFICINWMRHRKNEDKNKIEKKYYKGMSYCESYCENHNFIPKHIRYIVKANLMRNSIEVFYVYCSF